VPELNVVEAIRDALAIELERDERVLVLGLDVGELGGVFRATQGLLDRFGPDYTFRTPVLLDAILAWIHFVLIFGLVGCLFAEVFFYRDVLPASTFARRTSPSSTSRATRRVIPDREMSARSASSVMRSSPPATASWASTSKSAKARPVSFSRSLSSWRIRGACARSSACHAPNPRPPGSSLMTSLSRRPATSGSGSTCICNKLGSGEVFAVATVPSQNPKEERQ